MAGVTNTVPPLSTYLLDVKPLPCIVDGREGESAVFDAWSWCASDVLEWRTPTGVDSRGILSRTRIGADNPAGLAFVMRDPVPYLPSELARLHAFGYDLGDEMALAPWAIDDATDRLYEHRRRPADVFWLAASSLEALVWGLHDWAHFHSHGPFDQPAMTELQCDLVALAWLRGNATAIGLPSSVLDQVAADLAGLSRRRFAEERIAAPVLDLDALFRGPYPVALR